MNNIPFWRVLIFWNLYFFGFAIFLSVFLSIIFSLALHFNHLELVYDSAIEQSRFWFIVGLTISPFFALKPALKYIEKDVQISARSSCNMEKTTRNLEEMNLSDIRTIWRSWIMKTVLLVAVVFLINYKYDIYSEYISIIVIFIFATFGAFNMWQILNKLK